MITFLAALTLLAAASADESADWVFLDNGQLRLGVKKTSGAAIAWLSQSGSSRNLVNHFDRGRLIQQSYYGDADGSLWNKKPWCWNPVQGGDWRGTGARLLDFRADKTQLYARTEPRHWASGTAIADATMEEWINLTGHVAHVRYKFAYHGATSHKTRPQEVPAVFVPADLETLVISDGAGGVNRSQPGWPNEYRKLSEPWAAYVDKNDFGLGVCVPVARELTCYRVVHNNAGDCSYFAPLVRFAIGPGFVYEYDVYLTIGTSANIQRVFRQLLESKP